jgi:hypothetical protein
MLSPRETGLSLIIIDELTNEEFPISVSVLFNPLIVLLENVIALLSVTSGAAHSSPEAVPEFAVKTFPFVPTDKIIGVEEEEALIKSPFAVRTAVPIVSILFI